MPAEIGGRSASLSIVRSRTGRRQGKRLFHNSLDGRLIGVDAKIGKAATNFGKNGWINLRNDMVEEPR